MEDVETDGEMCEGVENGRKMEEEETEKEIKWRSRWCWRRRRKSERIHSN